MKSTKGHILESQNDIKQELVTFFVDLLSESDEERARDTATIMRNIPKMVTPEHNALLMRAIKREEVEEVVFQMEKGKASGLDSFTVNFFQQCWDLVKDEVWAL